MSLSEGMLKQSTMARQVKRGLWEHFSVNAFDGSKACCEICEELFKGIVSTYLLHSGTGIGLFHIFVHGNRKYC